MVVTGSIHPAFLIGKTYLNLGVLMESEVLVGETSFNFMHFPYSDLFAAY